MTVEMIKMSSKGQVVIPQDIRTELNADNGTIFAVIGGKDTIILKKIATPSKEELMNELSTIAKEGKDRLQKKALKETDIESIVQRRRARN